jgi:hypothetical protein
MYELIQNTNKVKIMTTELENSSGYGRIIELHSEFLKIKEEKDCLPEEKLIKKINCGIYSFNTEILCKYLPYLNNNNSQNEYYLTDIIEIIKMNEKIKVDMFNIPNNKHHEIMGINTKEQLLELEKFMKN